MPNHITNILTFKGDAKKIEDLLLDIKGEPSEDDCNDEYYIDFNRIIPMPKSLDMTSGSITDTAVAVYLAKEEHNYSRLDILMAYPCYESKNFDSKNDFIKYLEEQCKDENLTELGRQYVLNQRNYGAYTWYEWCRNNWGTKWNAYDQLFNTKTKEITFNTAWNGVPNLIKTISEKHPEVEISYKYADEDFGFNLASMKFLAGNVIEVNMPKEGSKKAHKLASEILGYNPYEE